MVGRPAKYTVEEVVDAIHKTYGIVSHAATYLNCARSTIEDYVRQHQEVREALSEERHAFVNLAEQKLREAIERCEPWAVSLVLKTLGKERGYTEGHEVTGTFKHEVYASPTMREVIVRLPPLPDAADDDADGDTIDVELLPAGIHGGGSPLGGPDFRDTPPGNGPCPSALQAFSAYTVRDKDDDDDTDDR